ncbi:MAG: hypothetical protein ACOYBR_02785 [Fluviibacter sp.]
MNDSKHTNLLSAALDSSLVTLLLPPLLWIGAWNLQLALNQMVGMVNGFSVILLTAGVRVFTGVIFGASGLITLTIGTIVWFYFVQHEQYNQSFLTLSSLSVIYSIVVFSTIEIVRKLRGLDKSFTGVKMSDFLVIVGASALISNAMKYFLIPYPIDANQIYSFALTFLSRFVGTTVAFFTLMLAFQLLMSVAIKRDA